MTPKRVGLIFLLLAAAALIALLLIPSDAPNSDEEQVRAAIGEMARAARERDLRGVLEHVSERYRGAAGDKSELKRYLAAWIIGSAEIDVVLGPIDVTMEEGRAKASFTALLKSSRSALGGQRIEAVFEREGENWRAVEASWRQAEPGDLIP